MPNANEIAREIARSMLKFEDNLSVGSHEDIVEEWSSTPEALSLISQLSGVGGMKDGWQPMTTAPKDRNIEGLYDGDIALICWSDRPVCMGGPTVYNKAGWATAVGSGTDSNLPMDEPEAWRDESPIPSGEQDGEGVKLTGNIHELKVWPQYFDDLESGKKNFEVRKMDRLFGVGDTLHLREWSPIKGYSGRKINKIITYIMPGGQWGLTEGNCILGIIHPPLFPSPTT